MWREAHDAGECRRKKTLQPLARGLPELWRGFLARGAQQQAEQNQAAGERSNGKEGGRNLSHVGNVYVFGMARKQDVVFCTATSIRTNPPLPDHAAPFFRFTF